MDKTTFSAQERMDLITKIQVWALENYPEDFHYGSPSRYWRIALVDGLVSDDEYEYVKNWMGDMFYYTGD